MNNPREREEALFQAALLQQIGEGGCGVVYMAEQEEPIRRRAAFRISSTTGRQISFNRAFEAVFASGSKCSKPSRFASSPQEKSTLVSRFPREFRISRCWVLLAGPCIE